MREDLDLPAQRNELAACRTRTFVLPVRRTCLAGIHKAMAIKSFPNKCRHRAQRNSPGHGQSDATTASVGRGESFTQSRFCVIEECAQLQRQPALAGRSEEHTSEPQSLMRSSYAVFCL